MDLETVAPGVHRVGDGIVNWYVLEEAGAVTLVDAGFPRQMPLVESALAALGRSPADVRAVLITHAHIDHIGAAEQLRREHGASVHAHAEEVDALRGRTARVRPSVLSARLTRDLWRAHTWHFISHSVKHGFLKPQWVSEVRTVADGEAIEVPGRPRALFTPGHTKGHLAYVLPGAGAVVSGDALTTWNVVTGGPGPQLEALTEDPRTAYRSLERFAELDVDLLLPGHGAVWRGSLRTAVDRARAAAPASAKAA